MNTIKLNFIPFVLCLAFLSNFLVIHERILSLNTHVDLSLIRLRSPRRFLRRLCCCNSSCSSDDSCSSSHSSSSSIEIGPPTHPKHVWSVTSRFGGFKEELQSDPPRSQDGEQVDQQEGSGDLDQQEGSGELDQQEGSEDLDQQEGSEDLEQQEDSEKESGCCSNSCGRNKQSGPSNCDVNETTGDGSDSESAISGGSVQNPYGRYNGRSNS
ncbi:putative integral membrane protein [Cryptosporidium meleagridis]|uniref:Putative integral membrane protein n=1 Tax=Cryptosporidium meleagridis TaxID=93969 RepID=A0A2P4Z107_9CRYT|nr:putative integral membrane protein [Cryptosporidium meleagridis]